jgi:hypothetical protein
VSRETIEKYVEFEAPCCHSVRTCYDTSHYIISLRTAKVLRRIPAVRCYKGLTRKYKFYPSGEVILVYHYVSNRGVNYIKILWKPENIDVNKAVDAARKALNLDIASKIVIEGEEVREIVEEG